MLIISTHKMLYIVYIEWLKKKATIYKKATNFERKKIKTTRTIKTF